MRALYCSVIRLINRSCQAMKLIRYDLSFTRTTQKPVYKIGLVCRFRVLFSDDLVSSVRSVLCKVLSNFSVYSKALENKWLMGMREPRLKLTEPDGKGKQETGNGTRKLRSSRD